MKVKSISANGQVETLRIFFATNCPNFANFGKGQDDVKQSLNKGKI